MEEQHKQAPSGSAKTLKIVVIILAVLLVGLVAFYFINASQWSAENEMIEAERDSIAMSLNSMLVEYDQIKTDNEEMNQQLQAERIKVETLMDKLKNTEKVNYAKIKEYEKETETLRKIMRNYIVQIDSLNTLSQHLIAENQEVKRNLMESRQVNKQLEEEKQNLSKQVQKGAMLKVRDLIGMGLNSRDKDTDRASRTTKFRICFLVSENTIAKPGLRYVYVKLFAPGEKLFTNANNEIFFAEGDEHWHSAKREIDYQGQELETCVYYDASDLKLETGKYRAEVYIDGGLAGQAEFLLK